MEQQLDPKTEKTLQKIVDETLRELWGPLRSPQKELSVEDIRDAIYRASKRAYLMGAARWKWTKLK